MDDQSPNSIPLNPRVKATFQLRSETFSVNLAVKGPLSEELTAMKEESMNLLKEFIMKNNIPNDVPDEVVESGSEDETVEELVLGSCSGHCDEVFDYVSVTDAAENARERTAISYAYGTVLRTVCN
ncbi:hypothetical protein ACLOJK_025732 [Asimina triloba]